MQYLLAAARGGGVFTVEQQGKQSATRRRLGPDGSVVWSRTLPSTVDGRRSTGSRSAKRVATSDGGVSVFGSSVVAVDFDDRALASGSFVAGFNASGATQWAFHSSSAALMALTAQGEILIAGDTAPGGIEGAQSTDTFLSM